MTLILFILILGIIIFIHELGHFLFAKKAGIYVYEFALGMGPTIYKRKSKNGETIYSLHLIPIGGFCSLAGEGNEGDGKVPKERLLQNKSLWQRFLTLFCGPGFNFILALFLLFMIGLCFGSVKMDPIITSVVTSSPSASAGISNGDRVLEINHHKISTVDDVALYLAINNNHKDTEFVVKKANGTKETYHVTPTTEKDKKGNDIYHYGINLSQEKDHGFFAAIRYMIQKTASLFKQMWVTITSLFTGGIKVNQLSGPVGIYSIVGEQSKSGFANILYLIAFLSINVGFINLLPIPAFDGGHIMFLIIEKIKGSPIKAETENMIHNIGFFLLMILMIYITFNDIFRLFS
ncbi:MAG: RIP metalloprotease RseP [Bacilli bacterium]